MDSIARSLIVFALLCAAVADAAPQLSISALGYRIEQVAPVAGARRSYDVTARAGVINTGDAAVAVTARIESSTPSILVLDGNLSFGNVGRTPVLRPAISIDTFQLRIVLPESQSILDLIRFARSALGSLSWQLSCGNCRENRPPVANAGAGQTVYVTQFVQLDGSASADADGQPLTYRWTVLARPPGSSAQLSSPAAIRPTFTADREGEYVFQLTVNDGISDSAPATVTITTLNSPPVANAGADLTAAVGTHIHLSAAGSSDVDGDTLIYEWTLLARPAGSAAMLLNSDPASPLADFIVNRPGEYLAQVIVNDGSAYSVPDAVVISTVNSAPLANAGPDRTARAGELVELSGAASSDIDGDPLQFRWSLTVPAGSQTVLTAVSGITTGFVIDKPGIYVAQLIVNDGLIDSEADTAVISTINSAPVAHAGQDQSVEPGQAAALDGSASYDADNDPLSFAWSLSSQPPGSGASLSDPYAIRPFLSTDLAGLYVGQLIVNDGITNSAPATLTVMAHDAAPPPLPPGPLPIPDLARISVMTDGEGGAVVAGMAGSVAAGSRVVVDNFATGATSVAIATADGAFSLVVEAATGDALLISVRDDSGRSSPPAAVGVDGELGLVIDSPVESQHLTESTVLVSGEVFGPVNTGVIVNGTPAVVYRDPLGSGAGSSWEAQIELIPDPAAIESARPVEIRVAAYSPDGRSVVNSINALVRNFSTYTLRASANDGPAPMQVVFDVEDNSGRGIDRIEFDFDGNGTTDLTSFHAGEGHQWTYAQPGTYVATAKITDSFGLARTVSTPIRVREPSLFFAELRAVWEGMTAALLRGNVPVAAARLTESARRQYVPAFEALRERMPQIVASLSPLEPTEAGSDIAEFVTARSIDGDPRGFLVYLARCPDGVWRVAEM